MLQLCNLSPHGVSETWVHHSTCILYFIFFIFIFASALDELRWSCKCNNCSVFFPAVSASTTWCPHMGQGKALCINGHPWQCAAAAGMEPPARAGSWLASGPDDALAFTEHLFWAGCLANRHRSPSSEGNQGMNMAMKKFSSA
jgi:hypothetical protein